ncbi:MAG TPA: hypothetical protein VL295_09175, partial [Gemmatimonadales bacterium]|nr:hypothetical protein [Gemmatimonadales bacterium]
MRRSLTAALLSLLCATSIAAQNVQPRPPGTPRPVPPPQTDDLSPFHRLQLPTANTIRTGSGKPGKDYWQQRADYTISATLDTTRRALTGEEKVVY